MEEKFMSKINEHYDSAASKVGYDKIMFVALYGSQNYDLATDQSDVDTKTLILPTLDELMRYHKISTTIQGDSDGGLCDLKHIQLMFHNFMKQNINFLEILYTDYCVINTDYLYEYNELISKRDLIAGCNPCRMIHAAGGMAKQKYHAMEKPFEGKLEILAKYGYDPKQLASLLRLEYFINKYLLDGDFYSAIHPCGEPKYYILEAKAGNINLDCARKTANLVINRIEEMIDLANIRYCKGVYNSGEMTKKEKEAKEFLDDLSLKLIKKNLKKEILE